LANPVRYTRIPSASNNSVTHQVENKPMHEDDSPALLYPTCRSPSAPPPDTACLRPQNHLVRSSVIAQCSYHSIFCSSTFSLKNKKKKLKSIKVYVASLTLWLYCWASIITVCFCFINLVFVFETISLVRFSFACIRINLIEWEVFFSHIEWEVGKLHNTRK
jgi:hypothetical protein